MMSTYRTGRARVGAIRRRTEERQRTQIELLEAAGHVFAEKGFDRATGKEICERAGTNNAAVNYYFGGMEGLYAAVIEEAAYRLPTLEELSSAIAGKTQARDKLETVLNLVAETLTGPLSSSWVMRVLAREFLSPSAALDPIVEKQGLPKLRLLKSIVSDIMGLPQEHPAVALGCINVIAPCAMLLLADRHVLGHAFPALALKRENAPALARHLLHYALAGLTAVARDATSDQTP